MEDNGNKSQRLPLLLGIAAVLLLTAEGMFARTTTLRESAPPGADRLADPAKAFHVSRLSRGDLFGAPRPRRVPAAHPSSDYSESYGRHRERRARTFAPARVDGILMDDPAYLDLLCRTV